MIEILLLMILMALLDINSTLKKILNKDKQ